jgi:hypothetical protein
MYINNIHVRKNVNFLLGLENGRTRSEHKHIIMRKLLYLEDRAMCTAGARSVQMQVATVCTGSMCPVLPLGGAILWFHHMHRQGQVPHSPLTTAVKHT